MSTSMIEGSVEAVDIRMSRAKVIFYRTITFRRADGGREIIPKLAVHPDVAAHLTPGSSGRFFLFKTFDAKGLHGVRLPDGTAKYVYPGSNSGIFLMLLIVNALWCAFMIYAEDRLPFLAVPLMILGIVGLVLTRRSMAETKAQFESAG